MTDFVHATPHAFHQKRVHRLGPAANCGIEEAGVSAAMPFSEDEQRRIRDFGRAVHG